MESYKPETVVENRSSLSEKLKKYLKVLTISAASVTAGYLAKDSPTVNQDHGIMYTPVEESAQPYDFSDERVAEDLGISVEGVVELGKLDRQVDWALNAISENKSETDPRKTLANLRSLSVAGNTDEDIKYKGVMSGEFIEWIVKNHPEAVNPIFEEGMDGDTATAMASEYWEEYSKLPGNTSGPTTREPIPLSEEELKFVDKYKSDAEGIIRSHAVK